jgi:hypothetical protein
MDRQVCVYAGVCVCVCVFCVCALYYTYVYVLCVYVCESIHIHNTGYILLCIHTHTHTHTHTNTNKHSSHRGEAPTAPYNLVWSHLTGMCPLLLLLILLLLILLLLILIHTGAKHLLHLTTWFGVSISDPTQAYTELQDDNASSSATLPMILVPGTNNYQLVLIIS